MTSIAQQDYTLKTETINTTTFVTLVIHYSGGYDFTYEEADIEQAAIHLAYELGYLPNNYSGASL